MDKYEYKLKLEQLKNLVEEKDYKTAGEIADSINWRKVKSAATLCMVGEIYDRNKRYEESREILLMAYDRAAVGRNILYRLTLVSLKMGDLDEAKGYYEDFLDVAPYDNRKYILRYQIAKLGGASLQELIDILEEFKSREFIEEWAFELAYLYHRAGESERCVDVCDELVLWFGDGKYVEKALEMKMLYEPLNQEQEEKYRQFKQYGDGGQEVHPSEMMESREIIQEEVKIPDIAAGAGKFNTSNLQEEIAKSMQQIMDANSKETVTDTMDNIKKMVEDIPLLKVSQGETELTEEQFSYIETDEEIDSTLKTQFEELLAEDWDGQVRMSVQGGRVREPQVNGQMKMEDVLSEWERTKLAAQTAMATAQERRLVSAKARALQEANDLMNRLHEIIPKLEAGVSPQELLEERYLHNLPPGGNGIVHETSQQEWEEGHFQPVQEWEESYPQSGSEMEEGYSQPVQEWKEGYGNPQQVWKTGDMQAVAGSEEGYPQAVPEMEERYGGPSQVLGAEAMQAVAGSEEGYPQAVPGMEESYRRTPQGLGAEAMQPGQNWQQNSQEVGISPQQGWDRGGRQAERSWEEELSELPPGWGQEVQELPPGWGGEVRQPEIAETPQVHSQTQAHMTPEVRSMPEAQGALKSEEPGIPREQGKTQNNAISGSLSSAAGLKMAENPLPAREGTGIRRTTAGYPIPGSLRPPMGYPKAGNPLPSMNEPRVGNSEAKYQELSEEEPFAEAALEEISSWEETSKILGEPIPKEYLEAIKREISRRVENLSEEAQVQQKQVAVTKESSVREESIAGQETGYPEDAYDQEGYASGQEAAYPNEELEEESYVQEDFVPGHETGYPKGTALQEPVVGQDFVVSQEAGFSEEAALQGPEACEGFIPEKAVISPEEGAPEEHVSDAMEGHLEKLIEQQTIQQTAEQEERDADKYLQSVFQAARESREEKAALPKIKLEEPEGHLRKLSSEQKEIFSYFVPISGMEQQLCQALEGVLHRKAKAHTSSSGNVLIMGGRGSGKTVLATDFIKAVQKSGTHPHGKVGKINGSSLNQKDLGKLMKKVAGGYLIIEKAGDVSRETAVRLSCLMDQDTDGLLVIMEDTRKGIEKVLRQDSNFALKFTEKIKIPIFTSDELVQFARIYALEQECEIDDVGILALYNRISSIQKLDEATTLTEIKEIVDEAIHRAERGGLKKLFGGKKFSPEGNLYLREKDFED